MGVKSIGVMPHLPILQGSTLAGSRQTRRNLGPSFITSEAWSRNAASEGTKVARRLQPICKASM